MATKSVDKHLRILCELVVAGLDLDLSTLSDYTLERLMEDFDGNKQKALNFCENAARGGIMLDSLFKRYSGGYERDGVYAFIYHKNHAKALIMLTEEKVRAAANGSLQEVNYGLLNQGDSNR